MRAGEIATAQHSRGGLRWLMDGAIIICLTGSVIPTAELSDRRHSNWREKTDQKHDPHLLIQVLRSRPYTYSVVVSGGQFSTKFGVLFSGNNVQFERNIVVEYETEECINRL